ncbi:Predicted ATP-dependent endonuclease of the OLD family [Fructobacillus fructosus]|uniref:Contains P-loop ATPase and TOPRIM domains (YbjD) n=1 Tax=Fructobacillus fructosus TaxID=1631 RepID=A0ABN9YXC3_9LACO|nr:AAA family ATPase [Fructobacillus fructosus]KRN52518.1 ATP-dependent OLD family endonuclease [Fructobacillus fructosus KCTC 3544]GAP01275.1 ATP-dependent OLD family endonuclease [Fructobacillus fructosus]CAK1230053.1 Predicted ATP-dependent endonuclease of the OLD family [Fructobacillus fructosus]CAK1242696.1 Predicted ATP-dependent endonuclease of the OLD family [Fructobacillus fructosus]
MKIKSVHIKNFRSIYDQKIIFYNITNFVGPNGAGKSTILYALDWFFNGNKYTQLSEKDATFGHSKENIEVSVTFDNLTDYDREIIGSQYVNDDSNEFTVWRIHKMLSDEEILSANVKGYPPFSETKASKTATEKKNNYQKLRDNMPDLGLPDRKRQNDIDEALREWENTHPENLEDIEESLSTSFKGFAGEGRLSKLFEYTLVRADLRANEETADVKKTLFSNIIERVVDRQLASEPLQELFDSVQDKEKDIYKKYYANPLNELTSALNEHLRQYSVGRKVRIQPDIAEILPPQAKFNIAVIEEKFSSNVENQGHGFQRTLLIAALQLLSENASTETSKELCLAIEEPELYQHPIQQKRFAHVLKKLTASSEKKIQVIYATHSPNFLDVEKINQTYKLKRNSVENDDIHTEINNISDQELLNINPNKPDLIKNALGNELANGIFSEGVFLVEGPNEVAYIDALTEKTDLPFSLKGIEVIKCPKTNMPFCIDILKKLGIPIKIMFDNDSGFETRMKEKQKGDEKKTKELRNQHINNNKKILEKVGIDIDTDTNGFILPGNFGYVFVVSDTLESYFSDNVVGWEKLMQQPDVKKNSRIYQEFINSSQLNAFPKELIDFITNDKFFV